MSATEQRPSIPANVDAAIRCALEKLPADRFTGAQDFARALGDVHFRHGEALAEAAGAAAGPWNRLTAAFAGVSLFRLTERDVNSTPIHSRRKGPPTWWKAYLNGLPQPGCHGRPRGWEVTAGRAGRVGRLGLHIVWIEPIEASFPLVTPWKT